jgi:hypothetical protein
VETDVAMVFAVSWNPFIKSKARPARTMSNVIMNIVFILLIPLMRFS